MQNTNCLAKQKTALSCAVFTALNVIALNAFAQNMQASQTIRAEHHMSAEQIVAKYHQGEYSTVAKVGSEYLQANPRNTELRYMVANSFAWTGRSEEAIVHYKALQGTDQASKANLGLANVYRWNGMPGLAAPLYRQVLSGEPGNSDAAEGMAYAMRELRPRTQLRLSRSSDSLDTDREAITLGQRWTDPSLQHTFELEAGALQDERNAVKVNQRDLTLRYAGVATTLKPRLEISLQERPRETVFAAGEIVLPNTPVTVSAGRVNWGKMVFDPNALRANLTANQVGIGTSFPSDIGMWRMGYRAYRVSDDNVIQDANINYTPAWQPLNIREVKFFVGFDGRKARFNSPAYWSPADGNYLGVIGVNAEWVDRSWERSILLQYGVPLGGEAENSYSGSAGIKRWVNDSFALGFSIFAQKSQRTGSYRANTAMLSVQGIW